MAEPGEITSRRNARVVAARKLAQRKHRRAEGRFLVEGLQLVHMALDAGAHPREAFYCADQAGPSAAALRRRLADAGAEVLPVTPHVMDALAEREVGQGLVAAFDLVERGLDELVPPAGGLALVLDRLQDPGNLGTLIRTADAVGASAIVLVEPSVDPFDPKAVRGSMGSIFHVPLARVADPAAALAWAARRGLRPVAADAHAGEPWGDALLRGGVALVLGNEARGLSPDVDRQVTHRVRLPVVGRAESLNVAVAGGVLMYAWLRANERGAGAPQE